MMKIGIGGYATKVAGVGCEKSHCSTTKFGNVGCATKADT